MDSPKDWMREYPHHLEDSVILQATPESLFSFLDDHRNLGAHMSGGKSAMLGMGGMTLKLDGQRGKKMGAHIVMTGSAFGFKLFIDEIVSERQVSVRKSWETLRSEIVVIGHYRLGFLLAAEKNGTRVTVQIDYENSATHPILSFLGGKLYAKWCVRQMLSAVTSKFAASE
jgi:hypothetical protein